MAIKQYGNIRSQLRNMVLGTTITIADYTVKRVAVDQYEIDGEFQVLRYNLVNATLFLTNKWRIAGGY